MRTLFGAIIIAVGLGMLLEATGAVDFWLIFHNWWAVIIIGIAFISWRSNPRIVFWPLVIGLFGLVILFSNLQVLPGHAWDYFWPLLIIIVGGTMLFRSGKRGAPASSGSGEAFAAFSGADRKVNGLFTNGKATALFGGTKFDLRDCQIEDGASLEVFSAFGGVEVLVPRSVKVEINVTPLFGGSENKTSPDPAAEKTIHIRGTAIFGGVEVKN